MKRQFDTKGLLSNSFNLVFSCEGFNLFETKEEARKNMVNDYGEEQVSLMEQDGLVFEDTYEKSGYAIFKNKRGNIVVLETQCFDYSEETLPNMDDLIEYVIDCLSDDINEENNDSLIIYVYKTFGNTIDYILIYDFNFYTVIENLNPITQIGSILEYIQKSINDSQSNGRWKYSMIVNGCYKKINNYSEYPNDDISDILCDSIDGNMESFWEGNV